VIIPSKLIVDLDLRPLVALSRPPEHAVMALCMTANRSTADERAIQWESATFDSGIGLSLLEVNNKEIRDD
jgi:hypothetical protein